MAVVLRPLGPSRVVAGLGNIYGKAMDRARLSPRRSERFQAKWKEVRVKKTRQTKNLEPRFDSIEAEKALEREISRLWRSFLLHRAKWCCLHFRSRGIDSRTTRLGEPCLHHFIALASKMC